VLDRDDAMFQAEKLAAFVAAGGSEKAWWASKGFTAAERRAINAAIRDCKAGESHGIPLRERIKATAGSIGPAPLWGVMQTYQQMTQIARLQQTVLRQP